jgi:ClpP class serine protease
MLLDGQTAASEYGVEALPTIVVVDREGRIVLRESGWSSLSAENVRDAVREALEE